MGGDQRKPEEPVVSWGRSERATSEPWVVETEREEFQHWRLAMLEDETTRWAAHPLCMVLAALDGETNPVPAWPSTPSEPTP